MQPAKCTVRQAGKDNPSATARSKAANPVQSAEACDTGTIGTDDEGL